MDKFVVPSLKILAFEASYKSVIEAVLEFRDYLPGEKRPADQLLMTREDMIDCFREHLNGPPVFIGNQSIPVFPLCKSTLSDIIRLIFSYMKLYHMLYHNSLFICHQMPVCGKVVQQPPQLPEKCSNQHVFGLCA